MRHLPPRHGPDFQGLKFFLPKIIPHKLEPLEWAIRSVQVTFRASCEGILQHETHVRIRLLAKDMTTLECSATFAVVQRLELTHPPIEFLPLPCERGVSRSLDPFRPERMFTLERHGA